MQRVGPQGLDIAGRQDQNSRDERTRRNAEVAQLSRCPLSEAPRSCRRLKTSRTCGRARGWADLAGDAVDAWIARHPDRRPGLGRGAGLDHAVLDNDSRQVLRLPRSRSLTSVTRGWGVSTHRTDQGTEPRLLRTFPPRAGHGHPRLRDRQHRWATPTVSKNGCIASRPASTGSLLDRG